MARCSPQIRSHYISPTMSTAQKVYDSDETESDEEWNHKGPDYHYRMKTLMLTLIRSISVSSMSTETKVVIDSIVRRVVRNGIARGDELTAKIIHDCCRAVLTRMKDAANRMRENM